jgi:diacylglycerol kinase family enzyme
MAKTITVIINKSSGADPTRAAKLREEIGKAFPTAKIHELSAGDQLANHLPPLDSEDAVMVVAAGGDGTVSTVAAELAGTNATLGVIPLGTFNHFAKDLGIPVDLEGALEVIKAGRIITVDVADANERVFINNSSFGLYPRLVRLRREHQFRLRCSKWWALCRGTVSLLLHLPTIEVQLTVDGRKMRRRTPFVFIGNNRYQLDPLQIGKRVHLNEGVLSIFTARNVGRLGLFRLALKALFGRLHADEDFDSFLSTEMEVETPRKWVFISFDGEVDQVGTPVQYRVRPNALRVIVPPEPTTRENA